MGFPGSDAAHFVLIGFKMTSLPHTVSSLTKQIKLIGHRREPAFELMPLAGLGGLLFADKDDGGMAAFERFYAALPPTGR